MAGNGLSCSPYTDPCGDGGLATEARINSGHSDIAIGPDGSLYIAEYHTQRIRRVTPDGIINTVAGNGVWGFSGDGGPATSAQLNSPNGIAIGPDGSIYIADSDNQRIRRVGPDGIINTVVGTGAGGFSGDGGPATEAQLYYPASVAIGPDGSLYISDRVNRRIRHVGTNGIITTVAGNGNICYAANPCGDGGPATNALIGTVESIATGPDDSLYIADREAQNIRRVGPDGIINTVAGTGVRGYVGDGGPAVDAQLDRPYGVAVGPDGSIYIAEYWNNVIRRVDQPLPGFTATDIAIPSRDGNKLYRFNSSGRHLQTMSTLTSTVLYDFNYDADGLLGEIVDGDGNTTAITRDANGNPTSITAPGSQTTNLLVNGDGYLEIITNPAGDEVALTYINNGLLNTFTDPNGNSSQYTYDAMGLLTLAEDRAGGTKALSRSDTATGYIVTKTTGMGRVTTYQMEFLPTGEQRSLVVYPNGAQTEIFGGTDGSSTATYPDGTIVTMQPGPDPRFGMQAPVLESLTIDTVGGVTNEITQNRTVKLADPDDVLSLQSIQDTTTINGRTYTYDYDATARSYTTTSPEGYKTLAFTDNLGRITDLDPAAGVDPITINYDEQGLITQTTQGAQSWSFTYDSLNRVISRIDAAGNESAYSYDDADRIVQVGLPGGTTEGYAYDANGNFTQLTMPGNDVHTLGYTALDFLASYTPPGNPSYSRSYNLDRALVSRTLPGNRVVANSFDDTSGQWTDITYPEATVAFVYHPSSDRLASHTWTPSSGTAQSVTYDYDGGHVTGQMWSGVADGDLQYSYDNNFFLANITLNSGTDTVQTPFTWDGDGKLTGYGPFTLTRGGPGGAVSQIDDSALTMAIAYDTLARVQSRSQVVNGNPVYDFSLTRNNVGRITQKLETTGGVSHTYTYSYDAKWPID